MDARVISGGSSLSEFSAVSNVSGAPAFAPASPCFSEGDGEWKVCALLGVSRLAVEVVLV